MIHVHTSRSLCSLVCRFGPLSYIDSEAITFADRATRAGRTTGVMRSISQQQPVPRKPPPRCCGRGGYFLVASLAFPSSPYTATGKRDVGRGLHYRKRSSVDGKGQTCCCKRRRSGWLCTAYMMTRTWGDAPSVSSPIIYARISRFKNHDGAAFPLQYTARSSFSSR